MLKQKDLALVDESVIQVISLLKKGGLVLKQKRGYKAGKLSASRNWCHIIDDDMKPRISVPNVSGRVMTWKLFARFDAHKTPSQPWERPQLRRIQKPQGMMAGEDVWGVSYETMMDWFKTTAKQEVIERLAKDLLTSFAYSHQRYC